MIYQTVQEVIDKIQREMDLEEETFVESPDEYYDYINEAIDEAEAEIHNLYQDYFRKPYQPSIVSGTARYALPTDIYANKIRFIQYRESNTRFYPMPRIKTRNVVQVQDSDDYSYDIENVDAATGIELVIYPTPRTTGSDIVTIWYIRNANRVSALTDKVDIPEFINFIYAFTRVKVAMKETSPLLQVYMGQLEQQRALMKQVLDRMIPDEHEVIEPDFSFYDDYSDHYNWNRRS